MLNDLFGVLVSHGPPYVPEFVGMSGTGKKKLAFRPETMRDLVERWNNAGDEVIVIDAEKTKPVRLQVTVDKGPLPFDGFLIHIERDYLSSPERIAEFLTVLKQIYNVLRPSFGQVSVTEMRRLYDDPIHGKVTPGTDLGRGLPDIYWANFLGPEYVEMFGPTKIFSVPSPIPSVERLSDGGALLILSPSPLDYLSERPNLEKLRLSVKTYLGLEAFDTGSPTYRGRTPRFPDVKERKSSTSAPEKPANQSEWLSSLAREEWEKWTANNDSISRDFANEMRNESILLDFSAESLRIIDDYMDRNGRSKAMDNNDFLMKLAAYVSQVIIGETGALWSFPKTRDIPSLRIADIEFWPLERVQKTVSEGERFEPWYRFLREELARKERKASG